MAQPMVVLVEALSSFAVASSPSIPDKEDKMMASLLCVCCGSSRLSR